MEPREPHPPPAPRRPADRAGGPGSGKTVALQPFAWEVCGEADAVIPVIVPLLFYAGTPLDEWVRASLPETGQLRLDDSCALAAFLSTAGSALSIRRRPARSP